MGVLVASPKASWNKVTLPQLPSQAPPHRDSGLAGSTFRPASVPRKMVLPVVSMCMAQDMRKSRVMPPSSRMKAPQKSSTENRAASSGGVYLGFLPK